MKTTQELNRLEARLLAMLRPTEMLRFVFSQTNHGRITVTLEGASESATSLMQRISTILKASRSEGLVFDQQNDMGQGTVGVLPGSAESHMIEIVPDTITLNHFAKEPLGFTERNDGFDLPGNGFLEIPKFPISGWQPRSNYSR